MSIKYAVDVVKEIKGRGAIVLPDDGVCGEDFEKWLKAKASGEMMMKSEPLTLQELKEMAGKPVYCPDVRAYGIVKYDSKGRWADIPFLLGAWYGDDGVAVNFEYNIKERGLRCYRVEQEV